MKRFYKHLGWWDDGLDMPSFRGILVGALVMVLVVVVVTCAGAYLVQSRNCAYASQHFGKQTHYDFLAKCYIRINPHQMVPLDSWRAFKASE